MSEQKVLASNGSEVFPWHLDAWKLLGSSMLYNRVANGLMVIGVEGIGKDHFARCWAQLLLCSRYKRDDALLDTIDPAIQELSPGVDVSMGEGSAHEPQTLGSVSELNPSSGPNSSSPSRTALRSCGQCKSCLLFKSNNHVDFLDVKPEAEDKPIKIDQIRALTSFVYARPQIAGRRVVLISPGDNLNIAASNALLKCLEEPAQQSYLILVVNQQAKLLPTVRSRCQKIMIAKPSKAQAMAWLSTQSACQEVDPTLLQEQLAIAQGAPLRVISLDKDSIKHYHLAKAAFYELAAGKGLSIVNLASDLDVLPLRNLLEWFFLWSNNILKELMAAAISSEKERMLILNGGEGEECVIENGRSMPNWPEQNAVEFPCSNETLLHYLQYVKQKIMSVEQGPYAFSQFETWCYSSCRRVYKMHESLMATYRAAAGGVNLNKLLLIERLLLDWRGAIAPRGE